MSCSKPRRLIYKFATDRGGTKEGGNGEKQVHVEGLSQWKWRERKEVAGYMS